MRYLALATDYDGTLATGEQVEAATFEALARLRGSVRQVPLETGRRLEELLTVCPDLGLFDFIVRETGGVTGASACPRRRQVGSRNSSRRRDG